MEDTDRERSKEEFEKEIIASMKWLGLEWEGPVVHQTQRRKRYQECASQLIQSGKAYRVDEITEAVKFRMPKEQIQFFDIIKGAIQFDTNLFDDLVILKSDGFPTYNFACVVDDHDMEISHVIRGEDHISNTPRQIVMFRELGWQPPKYAHLPLILGSDGSPLSKRHGAVSLKAYEDAGFLPVGILNYLSLLGWGPGGNQEFFTQEELIKKFSLKRVNTTAAAFDPNKMRFINSLHLKQMSSEEYLCEGKAFLVHKGLLEGKMKDVELNKILLLFRERIKTWRDLFREADYCFEENITFDSEAIQKYFQDSEVRPRLKAVLEEIKKSNDFSATNLEKIVRGKAAEFGIEAASLIHPIRLAITGVSVSPSLFELMEVIGREKVMKRIAFTVENFTNLPMKVKVEYETLKDDKEEDEAVDD